MAAAGKVVKLSQADGPSVAVHICDRVLPYLEGLQDVCDDAQVEQGAASATLPPALLQASAGLSPGYLGFC